MKNEIETTTVEMGTDSKGRRIGKKIILEKIQRVSFDIDVDGCFTEANSAHYANQR